MTFVGKLACKSKLITLHLLLSWAVLFSFYIKQVSPCEKLKRLSATFGNLLANGHQEDECVWEIQVPTDYRVVVSISEFHFKSSCCSCTEDYVEFSDGFHPNSSSIGRFCAHNMPLKVYSSQNALRVQLFSSRKINSSYRNIFKASYKIIKGKFVATEMEAVTRLNISVPVSSKHYVLTVVAPDGWLKVTVNGFINNEFEQCASDYLLFKEMGLIEFRVAIPHNGKLCGYMNDLLVFTKGSNLTIFLHQSSFTNAKLTLTLKATKKNLAPCGGTFRNAAGYIYSHGYPKVFLGSSDCDWYIEVPQPQHYIELYFLEFNFTGNVACPNNIEIIDGWYESSVKIKMHCGNSLKGILSNPNLTECIIRAFTGGSSVGTFVLKYNQVKESVCSDQQYSCSSRECIDRELLCDGIPNCSDSSDELRCPKEKQAKKLYFILMIIVCVVLGIIVISLWRTWRVSVHRHLHSHTVENVENEDDYAQETPCPDGAPPTYNEALGHNSIVNSSTTSLPNYEEAILHRGNEYVTMECGNTVRYTVCTSRSSRNPFS
ncbi:LOW QUALITY PROTEIN: tolloid-like protein 2 [Xenia sp. Carnegie-2017]|uniref:LOW QUALITY PROTEIN: tolloid-like protein 2 n=1 Tax=Xenia sp. Carnegie-2017 TaxID=2897299 RepID=UPI001F046982|nr:LOW QUALITY PROTEIN: tolloid-like protein 2 [Xenia sp. Carnegie-2017]